MMKNQIIKTEEIIENGLVYVVNTHKNGSIVKMLKSDNIINTTQAEPIDTDIILCEILSVAEYNSCLLEISMG